MGGRVAADSSRDRAAGDGCSARDPAAADPGAPRTNDNPSAGRFSTPAASSLGRSDRTSAPDSPDSPDSNDRRAGDGAAGLAAASPRLAADDRPPRKKKGGKKKTF